MAGDLASGSVAGFLAVGSHVKAAYASTVSYTHSSLVKSIERILALPTLSTVTSANELSDLFVAGFTLKDGRLGGRIEPRQRVSVARPRMRLSVWLERA